MRWGSTNQLTSFCLSSWSDVKLPICLLDVIAISNPSHGSLQWLVLPSFSILMSAHLPNINTSTYTYIPISCTSLYITTLGNCLFLRLKNWFIARASSWMTHQGYLLRSLFSAALRRDATQTLWPHQLTTLYPTQRQTACHFAPQAEISHFRP